MQTKKQSLIEVVTSTTLGFIISLIATFSILPLLGIASTPIKNIKLTIFFTAISILRSYIIRRMFNSTGKGVQKDEWLHCVECEIEVPITEHDGNYFCSYCGLVQRNFY